MKPTSIAVFVAMAIVASTGLAGPSREPLRPAFATGAVAAVTGAFRIVTYNIENFGDGVGNGARTPDIAAAHARDAAALIARLDPDLVVLQEIENATALTLLNRALPHPYPAGYVTDFRPPSGRIGRHNVAVLSRVPIEDAVECDFGTMTGDVIPTRGFIRCTVPLPGHRRLVIYGTHLKSNFGRRESNLAQRRIATEAIRADADEALRGPGGAQTEVLLAGDMNTDPDSREFADDPTLDAFRGWVDLWRGRPLAERGTCPTRRGDPAREFPPAAFDRILVAPAMTNHPWVVSPPRLLAEGVNTRDVYALPGTGRGHVSDHHPVAVDIAP